jgi:hypothetical protein
MGKNAQTTQGDGEAEADDPIEHDRSPEAHGQCGVFAQYHGRRYRSHRAMKAAIVWKGQ